jgi:class 3 adenylate cyclase
VIEAPETQYAKTTDGSHIAFQIAGDGPLDLLFLPPYSGSVELAWELPSVAPVLRRLASFGRLITFNPRGTGLSDPPGSGEEPSLEEQAKEILVVLNAASSKRAALVANSVTGPLAIFFAASYPKRTSSLVLHGCYARLARAPDYPWGVPPEVIERAVARVVPEAGPGDYLALKNIAPHAMRDSEFVAQWGRFIRAGRAPGKTRAYAEALAFADVRPGLRAVQAPTLVLYRSGDRFAGKPYAEYLARHIAGATLVELPGEDNLIFVGDSDADVDEIEEFLTGARHAPETDRVLATVLFTDIVGSTERAAGLGDRRWRRVLDSHDQAVRRLLDRFGGREVHTAGDGFLATFDGPGRAIQCACAICDAVGALGVEVRVGLHTGEIEVRGEDVAGMAVHIGARVSSVAEAGEVLVSSTVKDLVVGSAIEFADRGEHELKGVPGYWRLFAVEG